MSEAKPKLISSAIGRRKSAIASVRLYSGSGEITVNGKPASEIFPGEFSRLRYSLPFSLLPQPVKYSASIKTRGGGRFGQLDAAVLGLARALSEIKNENQILMRAANLLTRDSRERQRRMVGMGGKSRRKKQSPKR